MELSAAFWVLSLIGAGILGFIAAQAVERLKRRHRTDEDGKANERLASIELELDDAIHRSRRELQRSNRLRTERDEARAELDAVRADLYDAHQQQQLDQDRIAVAERRAEEFEARFSDIVGLENELASLRVVASRVPELERRIDELSHGATDSEVIDLREPHAERATG